MREALDEPIPGGARFAYVFGSALLFIFVSQVITGLFLALYYVPSADHAHTTVAYIAKAVTAGRSFAASMRMAPARWSFCFSFMSRKPFCMAPIRDDANCYGSLAAYSSCLFCVWPSRATCSRRDRKAYFATAVGTNIAGEVPLVGAWLKAFMRGGADMGTLTLSRFFVAHVLGVPAAIFAFIALHVYLFRKAGAARPISEDPITPKQAPEPFYPRQVVIDAVFALLIIALLAFIAHFAPFDLGPRANPADTRYLPRPEWYYIPIFQWLKYWPGSLSFLGVVVIPGIVAFLFASLPFLDRRMERRPWKRPIAVGTYVFVFLTLFGLGFASYRGDHRDAGYAAQLVAQERDTARFMDQPFQAETSQVSVASSALIPLRQREDNLRGTILQCLSW